MAKDEFSRDDERFLRELDQVYLNDYPNPDRIGCPGTDVLKALARDRNALGLGHPAKLHLGHCSPCYREYIQFREKLRKQKTYLYGLAAAAVFLLLGGLSVYVWKVVQPSRRFVDIVHPVPYQTVIVDLQNRMVFRNEGPRTNKTEPRPSLSPGRLDLLVYLPIGSEDGEYDIHLLRDPGAPALASVRGTARLENNMQILRAKIDLRALSAGDYLLAIRHVGSGWTVYPVRLTTG